MVFNATFIDISAISWWSVLLVEKTRVTANKPELQTVLASRLVMDSSEVGIFLIFLTVLHN
jgi:hypothetical protein